MSARKTFSDRRLSKKALAYFVLSELRRAVAQSRHRFRVMNVEYLISGGVAPAGYGREEVRSRKQIARLKRVRRALRAWVRA